VTPEHPAARPAWDCATCGQPWPCAPAKEALLAEFAGFPTGLQIYLAGCLGEAIEALTAHGAPPPAGLRERFLTWATRRT
jgi:hypothetical protein